MSESNNKPQQQDSKQAEGQNNNGQSKANPAFQSPTKTTKDQIKTGDANSTSGRKSSNAMSLSEMKRKKSNVDNDLSQSGGKQIKQRPFWKIKMERFLNHWSVTVFMTMVTFYALFGDDIRLAFFTMSADDTFYALTFVSLILFFVEIILSCIAVEGYFNSFYFWLDLISTISLITDIGWIWDEIIGTENYQANNAEQASTLARAGRGARIGTKAGRITRVIRLIRLIRIVKLYKSANTAMNKQEDDEFYALVKKQREEKKRREKEKEIERGIQAQKQAEDQRNRADDEENQDTKPKPLSVNASQDDKLSGKNEGSAVNSRSIQNISYEDSDDEKRQRPVRSQSMTKEKEEAAIPQESKVGKKLSDLTTRRVIILVLAMLFSVPLFSVESYITIPDSYSFGLTLLSQQVTGSVSFTTTFDIYVETQTQIDTPLILVNADDVSWQSGVNPDELRSVEKEFVTAYGVTDDTKIYVSFYDLRKVTKLQAGLGIATTILVCFILASGSLIFNRITGELVITPIENMIAKVQRISQNPIQAAQEAENEQIALEEFERQQVLEQEKGGAKKKKKQKAAPMETQILEQTLMKIGGLLALGFGEAGAAIIAKNMQQGDDINPMIPGEKVICIFGFCDIRSFTDATEVLQEGVMIFVNEIGEIVHGIVDKYSGAANKNIGDAFLLVWKFEEEDQIVDIEKDDIVLEKTNRARQLCDMSMISFLKIIAALKRSRALIQYKEHPALNARMPNYSVKMGFGLHVGYAIEGAIGSFYKIDASYLSPNVNMAARLEAATKQFGVPLLISGELWDNFTSETQQFCRQIDCVTVKGSIEPLRLFTCDTEIGDLEYEPLRPQMTKQQQKQKRVKARMNRDTNKELIFSGEFEVSGLFHTDEDLIDMRAPFKKEFYDQFKLGYDAYIEGDWQMAKGLLEKIHGVKGCEDFPSKNLISFMKEHNFKAPQATETSEGWKGYRSLTEK